MPYQAKLELIMQRIGDLTPYNDAFVRLLKENSAVHTKIYKLWKIADELISHYGKEVPCYKGCSHCCHIPVATTRAEAIAIGKRIGVEPKLDLNYVASFKDRPFGLNYACPFLNGGVCSIYEHRPITCRLHHSIEDTEDSCRMVETGGSIDKQLAMVNNQMPFQIAMVKITQPKSRACLADFKEYFPYGLRKL